MDMDLLITFENHFMITFYCIIHLAIVSCFSGKLLKSLY